MTRQRRGDPIGLVTGDRGGGMPIAAGRGRDGYNGRGRVRASRQSIASTFTPCPCWPSA